MILYLIESSLSTGRQSGGERICSSSAFDRSGICQAGRPKPESSRFRHLSRRTAASHHVTLAQMIYEAYQGRGWLKHSRFNIEAISIGEPTRNEMMVILQSLLVERFQLKLQRQTRAGNAFELVEAKSGIKLKLSSANSSYIRLLRNALDNSFP